MLTYGTGRLLVTDTFGNFYDYQADAWLHGRWDVPEPALGGEAFVVDGKIYGYFGPTPALLRLPLVALGVAFGKLTRPLMAIEYAACLIGAYAILCQLARQLRGDKPGQWLTIAHTFAVGLGSSLFFLSSRAYVYHEAILCGAAFALWSVWATLRYIQSRSAKWAMVGALCGTLAVQARPPIGLFALVFLGVAAVGAAYRQRRILAGWSLAFAVAGVLSYAAVSYLKFHCFDGCPLRLNVQYTPERLAPLGERNFHLSNVRFNADTYLFKPSASLRGEFPYVFVEFLNRTKDYPESKIAYRDATLALPYCMPALVGLALFGLAFGLVRRDGGHDLSLMLAAAAIPMFGAMLTAVAVTQRYTADFMGWLVPAAALGGVMLANIPRPVARLIALVACVAVVVSIAVQASITLHFQRAVVWGAPPEAQAQYEQWRHRWDAFFRRPPTS